MASVSGTYRTSNIATVAGVITLLDAQLTAEDARMIVLGGAATRIIGSITMTITADDGASGLYSHKVTISLNCPALADSITLTAALSVLATAMEAESDYTNVVEVGANMNTTMSN